MMDAFAAGAGIGVVIAGVLCGALAVIVIVGWIGSQVLEAWDRRHTMKWPPKK